jgi:hypothetical protein
MGMSIGVATDPEVVRQVRELRASGASYQSLAEQFGLHHKSVYRLCRGLTCAKASGPLEDGTETVPVRCPKCRGMVFMPCVLCRNRSERWAAAVVRVLKSAWEDLLEQAHGG